jgi:hypothetical protein
VSNYRERLRIPALWWLFGAVFASSVGWIFLVVTTRTVAVVVALAVAVPLAWALHTYGSLTLDVTDGDLAVGRARLERRFQGPARALTAEEFRHVMGPGADARAFLLTRPYVRTGALVPVADAGDATPYWLVSTRHPAALVASLTHSGKDQGEPTGEQSVVEEE